MDGDDLLLFLKHFSDVEFILLPNQDFVSEQGPHLAYGV
jgi:hypothetical protein